MKNVIATALIAFAAASAVTSTSYARQGADDGASHERGGGADDGASHIRGGGADDGASHVRGGGADDGAGHLRGEGQHRCFFGLVSC